MSEIAIIVTALKNSLRDLSKQTALLGNGLYNAAPGDKQGLPNPSVQYLLAAAESMNLYADACEKIATIERKPDSE